MFGIKWESRTQERALYVLTTILLLLALRDCGGTQQPLYVDRVVPDTASAAEYRAEMAEARRKLAAVNGELTGVRGKVATLRAHIAGLENREPATVTVYDTVIDLRRDTVAIRTTINGDGKLEIMGAIPDTAGWLATRFADIDVRDCDGGIDIIGTTTICDRPRLGHMEVYGAAGAGYPLARSVGNTVPVAEVGLQWTPNFRSTWAVRAFVDLDARATLMVQRGLRIW